MKSYLITDPSYYHDLKSFEEYLSKIFTLHKVDFVCFRDKTSRDILPYAKVFIDCCKKRGVKKYIINSRLDIAKKLRFFGVHLTSLQLDLIKEAKEENFFVIASTHSIKEALFAQKSGADAVTISPIFASPNKGKEKGVDYLKEFNDRLSIKVFALGGIVSKKDIKIVKSCGVYGFASIRYFASDMKI